MDHYCSLSPTSVFGSLNNLPPHPPINCCQHLFRDSSWPTHCPLYPIFWNAGQSLLEPTCLTFTKVLLPREDLSKVSSSASFGLTPADSAIESNPDRGDPGGQHLLVRKWYFLLPSTGKSPCSWVPVLLQKSNHLWSFQGERSPLHLNN